MSFLMVVNCFKFIFSALSFAWTEIRSSLENKKGIDCNSSHPQCSHNSLISVFRVLAGKLFLSNRKYSFTALSVDSSSNFGFCYEQRELSVSVMNRKINFTTNSCWQQ